MASLLDSNVLAQPQQQQPKGENKQKNEGRNRRVLKDIGNLVVKQSDPIPNVPKRITRNLGAQLLPNAQATEKNKKPSTDVGNFVAATKVEQAKKPTEAEVIIISSDDEEEEKEKQTVKGGRKEIERVAVRGKNSKAFSSVLSARSKDDGRVHDYMPSQPDINMKMRSILVDWLIEVHRKFELMPETLYLTLNIIDRFLSMKAVPRRELQLVGISSMLIACKYEEIWAPEVNDFVYIADNAYVREHILIMEKTILSKLEWYLTVPTPYVFLIRYIKASTPSDKEIENMVFFLAELSLMDYSAMINYCPSLIAASAVYAARCTLGRSPYWTETLKHYTGYCEEQLRDCSKIMVNFHSAAPESKLRAVYKKFSNSERGAVALVNPAKNLLSSSPPPQS
ncbi:hypothetical protein TanjilG_18995 [Lupinus angustifolius]|uniref:B-like cyclin n=1 Tax=Lupinus angustifolius TaxID=3871 RepID=A0A4P1RRJ3_LUPAN|nr:hypothetical protein TanjilG_18995 [Lupinus angustifolius]